jgi:hypothetical protein
VDNVTSFYYDYHSTQNSQIMETASVRLSGGIAVFVCMFWVSIIKYGKGACIEQETKHV